MSINSITQPISAVPPSWTGLNVHSALIQTNLDVNGDFNINGTINAFNINADGNVEVAGYVSTDELLLTGNNSTVLNTFKEVSLTGLNLNNATAGIGPVSPDNRVSADMTVIGKNVNINIHYPLHDYIEAEGVSTIRTFTLAELGLIGAEIIVTLLEDRKYYFPLIWETAVGVRGVGTLEIDLTPLNRVIILRNGLGTNWAVTDRIFPMQISYVATQ